MRAETVCPGLGGKHVWRFGVCVGCGLEPCGDCGYDKGSFACRIRHQHVMIGWGRAALDE